MNKIFMVVPQFLRNPQAFYESVRNNEELRFKAIALFLSTVVFLMVYGFITGLSHSWWQACATAIKIPLLFLLTLLFTLPALYFFALALLNVRFSVIQSGVIVLAGLGVSSFLLLGLSPITLFFVLTSSNYPFFQLLAVLFVAISGVTGLSYILRGLTLIDANQEFSGNATGRMLLRAWVVVYGFVGAQMTWRLSPLVGDPAQPFILLQPSRDNFFVDVVKALQVVLGLNPTTMGPLIYGLMVIGMFVVIWLWLRPATKPEPLPNIPPIRLTEPSPQSDS